MTPKDFATATPVVVVPRLRRLRRHRVAQVGAAPNSDCNPKDVAFVSGIGCSGKISGYLHSYAFHGVHGRALPVATAVKLANNDLTVIAAGGDGDGFAIGAGHFLHAVRRNPNITYIVMDNQTYGLTKGQSSPTSDLGYVTGTSPGGNPDAPLNGIAVALAAGGTFIARGFSAQPKKLIELIKAAIEHPGFSVVEVMSPCVTFNKINTFAWFKENVYDVTQIEGYDNTNKQHAFQALTAEGKIPLGIIYQTQRAAFDDLVLGDTPPLATADVYDTGRFHGIQDAYR